MKIKGFNRKNIDELLNDLNAKLNEVAKEYGVSVQLTANAYRPDSVGGKVEIFLADEKGEKLIPKDEHVFANHFAEENGVKFTGNLIGSIFMPIGSKVRYKITGINRRASKNIIEITRLNDMCPMRCNFAALRSATILSDESPIESASKSEGCPFTENDFILWATTEDPSSYNVSTAEFKAIEKVEQHLFADDDVKAVDALIEATKYSCISYRSSDNAVIDATLHMLTNAYKFVVKTDYASATKLINTLKKLTKNAK